MASRTGNAAGLVRLLERLEEDRSLLREAGARARHAFEKYYDKPIGVAKHSIDPRRFRDQ